jgi:EmrB/QacA subfamily drug resistance transporter
VELTFLIQLPLVGVLQLVGPEDKKDGGYGWIVLSVTTLGALLASMQASALLIALPDIMSGLHSDFLTILWILLSYLLITTAMLPVIGRLADMFGRKRLYVLGFAVFTFGSLMSGLSQSQFHGWDMVGYRIIQGIGGALLIANSPVMVTDAFEPRRLGLGLGVNQIAIAAGLVIGPVIGGVLTPISWRWVFLMNVPLGIFGTLWGIVRLREPVSLPKGQSFDLLGALTFTVGLGALLMAASLIAFPLLDVMYIYALFIIGAIGVGAFFCIEFRVSSPMIDFSLFRNRDFALANLTNLLSGLTRGAVLFLLIFFLQGPYGQDPLSAGISLIPFGLAFMIVGPVSGNLSDRHGTKVLSVLGLAFSAMALLAMSTMSHTTPYWVLAVYMILMGVGSGLFNSPNMRGVMNSVRPERRGIAGSTRTMLASVGTMFSFAIALPLVLSNIPQEEMLRLFLYGGGIEAHALEIFENGLHLAFLIFFAVGLVAVIAALLLHRDSDGAHAAPENAKGDKA